MADQANPAAPVAPNPAPEAAPAPTPADANSEQSIADVFGLDSDDFNLDGFGGEGDAGAPASSPSAPAAGVEATPVAAAPGAGVGAPSPAPEPNAGVQAPTASVGGAPTPPLTGLEGAPKPAGEQQPEAGTQAPDQTAALQMASLQAQVQALQAELAATRGGQQPQAQPTGAQAPAGDGDDGLGAIDYKDLSIPDQLTNAIFSDDPATAKQGMNVLVQSLASIVHQKVRQETTSRFAAQEAKASQAARQTQEQAAVQQMQQDYYGAFPAHNNPVVKAIVQAESAKLAGEFPFAPWNEQYRDALGARVNAAIAALTGQPAPPPAVPTPSPAPANPAPPAKPAPFAPAGTRSALPSFGVQSQEDMIQNTFAMGGDG